MVELVSTIHRPPGACNGLSRERGQAEESSGLPTGIRPSVGNQLSQEVLSHFARLSAHSSLCPLLRTGRFLTGLFPALNHRAAPKAPLPPSQTKRSRPPLAPETHEDEVMT